MNYKQVQQIAKDTIVYIKTKITPGMHLTELRSLCEQKMLELGADSFWYWDIGAFVFAGDETAVSISGRAYQTTDRIIESDDIITIDLSPQNGDTWGDYARTIILENGIVTEPECVNRPEWRNGIALEQYLHEELIRFASPDTTFEELHFHMNRLIESKGFVNLDFAGNLGHSIARRKEDRIYIEKGNHTCLGDVKYFTFEPHISTPGSKYGFKMENIYSFETSILLEL